MKAAVDYLLREQEADGAWFGRWGTNYIYGTWSVLCALNAVGVPAGHPAMRKAVAWLQAKQRDDGGWGEDGASLLGPTSRAARARIPRRRRPPGRVLGLMAAGDVDDASVERGIQLSDRHARPTTAPGQEEHYTAVGFPRVFYLRYHGYRAFFPTLGHGALSQPEARQRDERLLRDVTPVLVVVTGLKSEAKILRGLRFACVSVGGKAHDRAPARSKARSPKAPPASSASASPARCRPDLRTGDLVVAADGRETTSAKSGNPVPMGSHAAPIGVRGRRSPSGRCAAPRRRAQVRGASGGRALVVLGARPGRGLGVRIAHRPSPRRCVRADGQRGKGSQGRCDPRPRSLAVLAAGQGRRLSRARAPSPSTWRAITWPARRPRTACRSSPSARCRTRRTRRCRPAWRISSMAEGQNENERRFGGAHLSSCEAWRADCKRAAPRSAPTRRYSAAVERLPDFASSFSSLIFVHRLVDVAGEHVFGLALLVERDLRRHLAFDVHALQRDAQRLQRAGASHRVTAVPSKPLCTMQSAHFS